METNNNEILEQNNMENVVQEQENIIQMQNGDNTSQNNKNNLKVIIIASIIIVLLALGVVFATSMLKSNEEKFFELLFKKQATLSMMNEFKNGQIDTNLEIDIGELAEMSGEKLEEEIRVGLVLSEVIKDKDASGTIDLVFNDDELITVEFAKTNDVYGMKIKDANEKFIAIQNKDLKDVLERFGMEDIEGVPDKFLTAEDFEKVMKMKPADVNKMLNKYIKVLADSSKDAVKVENNVEMKFADNEVKTKKYTLSVTEKNLYDILNEFFKTLKEDKKNIELVLNDTKAVLKLMEEAGYQIEGISSDEIPSVEEACEAIEELSDELLDVPEEYEFDNEEILMRVSVYEYKGKTVATEITDDYQGIIVKTLFDNNVYAGVIALENDEEVAAFVLKGTMNKEKLNAEFIVEYEGEKLKFFDIKQKQSNSTKNLVKLNDKNGLIINTASDEEIQEYAEEFAQGMEKIVEDLQEKIPVDELINNMGSQIIEMPTQDYDDEYDYNYDDFLEYDEFGGYDELVEYSGVLADAQSMYSKIQIGDSKASVIQKLGNPVEDNTYSMLEFMEWNSNIVSDMSAVEVVIRDGKVGEKAITLVSSKDSGVLIGKETNTTIDNLDNVINKVKEDMTLKEIENILGKAAYESSVSEYGYVTYTWCDNEEQSVDISFDKNGKAYYIGIVF